jgi:hypothetical protein
MPEVTLDVHEKSDGYYQVNTGCVTNANIAPALRQFSERVIYKDTEEAVTAAGHTWHEYLVTEAMGSQGAAGAPEPADEKDRPTLTRPSTTDLNDGRNSLGIYETISFIQEGASRHDIESLGERTAYQYLGVKALVQFRGREIAHTDLGRKLLTRFAEDLAGYGTAEAPPRLEGRNVHILISPVKSSKPAAGSAGAQQGERV